MTFAYVPYDKHDPQVNTALCRALMRKDWRHEQCARQPKTEPDADGMRWCLVHDPERQKAQSDKRYLAYKKRAREEALWRYEHKAFDGTSSVERLHIRKWHRPYTIMQGNRQHR